MEESYVVTSYINPDLDGISCMYAYKEFIEKCGRKSNYYISGVPKKEVSIVCDMFGISLNPIEKIGKHDNIILVDTNSDLYIEDSIIKENVTEIIDHHVKSESSKKFVNANLTIELIGAAATLVGKRFMEYSLDISDSSAMLLYYGIVSNTINFKSKNTSKKDKEVAKWLKSKCSKIDDSKIEEIFRKKSIIEKGSMKNEIEASNPVPINGSKSVIIGQLEIVEIDKFLDENEDIIKQILEEENKSKNPDFIFCNIIDILNGKSTLYSSDESTKQALNNEFNYLFEDNICNLNSLITRKELFKKLKNHYNN